MGLLDNTFKEVQRVDPGIIIIYSFPKVGKTEALLQLKGNLSIIFDHNGGDFYKGHYVSVPNVKTLKELEMEFMQKNPRYKYITLDTLTTFYEEMVNNLAVEEYNKTASTKSKLDPGTDINILDYGKGHYYKRNILQRHLNFFKQFCDTLIITGHIADSSLNKDQGDVTYQELAIEGKLKDILAVKIDAMGKMYRSSENTNSIIFNVTDSASGSRAPHLSGTAIEISRKEPDGSLTTYWERVFIGNPELKAKTE